MFRLLCRNVLSTTLYLIVCSMALFLTVTSHAVAHAAPLAQTNGQNLQFVDRLGGAATKIAVKGHYAYVMIGGHLVVLDVSNPTIPIYLTSTRILSEGVSDMVIADDLLYLFSGNLHIISISDPLYPVEVGTFAVTPYMKGSAAQGHYLFTNDVPRLNDDFTIVDVTKPASPVQTASYTYTEGTANGYSLIAVQGNYVYLFSNRARGLLILDISDRSNPQLLSRLYVTYWVQAGMTVVDETVYLSYADWLGNARIEGLELIDVSDPLAPKQKGKIVMPSGNHLLKNIEVSGNYVYWGGDPDWGGSPDIKIVNVTDPEHPVLETALPFNSYAFVVAENRLYNVSYQYGLQIFDLSIPATPTLISHDMLGSASFESFLIRDNYLYSTGSGQLQVRDLSKSTISAVGSLAVKGRFGTLDGNTAYLNLNSFDYGDTCYGYNAVDVTNPFSPTLALTYQFGCLNSPIPQIVHAVADQRLYASDYSADRLYIYDLTAPNMPILLSTYDLLGGTFLVNGQYAYLGGGAIAGMIILDVSGETTPRLVSVYPALDRVIRFIKRDSYLFALTTSGVTVFDISNPISPVVIGVVEYHDDRGYTEDFALEGDYIYMDVYLNHMESTSIKVFDIADLGNPTEVASYLAEDSFRSLVATADHKLYMPDGSYGLTILQLSGAISGKVVDSFGNPHVGVKVTLSDGQTRETNAQGDYSFALLTPGSYTVKAESPIYDFQPAEQTLRVPSYSSEATNFTLLLKPLSAALTPDSPTHLSYTDLGGNVLDFDLPAGVVAQPTTLSVLPQASAAVPGQFSTGVRFDLQTSEVRSASRNFTFTAPLTITIHYTDSAVAPVTDRNQLMLRWWDGSQWTDATTTCAAATPALHDVESQVLTITVCQSGQFALFGPTVQHFLPLVSRSQLTTPEVRGHFVAQHSGKCLNVLDESQQNGANIDQMPCDSSDSEVWTVRPQGEYVQLAAKHSQKCLRVASQVEGESVVQWSCTGVDNELWRLVSADPTVSSGNTFWLVNKQGGLCLTVQDASQEDKAQVIQSICNESQNQLWRFQAQN